MNLLTHRYTLIEHTQEAGKVRFERRTTDRGRKSWLAQEHFGPGEPSACLPE